MAHLTQPVDDLGAERQRTNVIISPDRYSFRFLLKTTDNHAGVV